MDKKISIVMGYYNRREQTLITLAGFENEYTSKYNFEVVIADDCSDNDQRLDDVITKYSYPIKYIYITKEKKGKKINPSSTYNVAIKNISVDSEYVIIQNPECLHCGDILGYVLNNLKTNQYFTFSCYNTYSSKISMEISKSGDPINLIKNDDFRQKNLRLKNDTCGSEWYNHPELKKTDLHFCSAIYKTKLDLFGGFNKAFDEGLWYDDNEFLCTIKNNLKLSVITIPPDECCVVHQFHVKLFTRKKNQYFIEKNKKIYNEMIEYQLNNIFKYPKLFHVYLDNEICENKYNSFISFIFQNKFWKIIIYVKNNVFKNELFRKITDYENVSVLYLNDDVDGNDNCLKQLQIHGGVIGNFNIIYECSLDNFIKDHNEDQFSFDYKNNKFYVNSL